MSNVKSGSKQNWLLHYCRNPALYLFFSQLSSFLSRSHSASLPFLLLFSDEWKITSDTLRSSVPSVWRLWGMKVEEGKKGMR